MAQIINLEIDQGTTFSTPIKLNEPDGTPIDLSTYTGAAQLRKHYGAANSVSMIVALGGNNGIVTLSLPASSSTSMQPGRYVYDVVLTSNTGAASRVVEGSAFVNPSVTR